MTKKISHILLICTLYSILCAPSFAQTSVLSIGVRGGGQTWLPAMVPGASGEVQKTFGGTGALDLRYTLYYCFTSRFGLGFTFGAGVGYTSSGLKGTNTDKYTNTDYLNNKLDYTVTSSFKQTDNFAQAEASLMFAMCFGNVIVNIGPRFMMPFAATSTLTLDQASIDAYYPQYNVHIVEKQITGYIETLYTQTNNSELPKYHLLLAAEVGYEWYIKGNHALGFQLYSSIGLWNSPSPVTANPSPLIQVHPITDAKSPVPDISVNSPLFLLDSRRYIDFGVRIYYAFNFGSSSPSPRINTRDTRQHHNRYMWY